MIIIIAPFNPAIILESLELHQSPSPCPSYDLLFLIEKASNMAGIMLVVGQSQVDTLSQHEKQDWIFLNVWTVGN